MPNVRETVKPGDLRGVRVLVVEDEWHVANALRSVLEHEGMEVSGPAGKAVEALGYRFQATDGSPLTQRQRHRALIVGQRCSI